MTLFELEGQKSTCHYNDKTMTRFLLWQTELEFSLRAVVNLKMPQLGNNLPTIPKPLLRIETPMEVNKRIEAAEGTKKHNKIEGNSKKLIYYGNEFTCS